MVNIRKAGRFLSKQSHLQSHFHPKPGNYAHTVKWSTVHEADNVTQAIQYSWSSFNVSLGCVRLKSDYFCLYLDVPVIFYIMNLLRELCATRRFGNVNQLQ